MGQDAEALRRDIEETRNHMTTTVDAIEDRVMPGRIIERRRNRMRNGVASVRDAVMGAPHQAKDAIASSGSSLSDDAGQLTEQVQQRAAGNPFAAGLIAFGAGMLAATLIPPSEPERKVAAKAKEAVEPLVEPLQDAARQVAEDAKAHGQEAVAAVQEAGSDAGAELAESARSTAKDTAQQAKGSTG